MLEELMMKLLIRDEGLRLDPYRDHLGFWTIGVGHLIDSRRGGKLPSWVTPSFPITELAALEMCRGDISDVVKSLTTKMPQFSELSEVRQAVLVSMAFQIGVGGLMAFKKTIAAITQHNWPLASAEMLNSDWFKKQTATRAARLSRAMLSNELASFELVA